MQVLKIFQLFREALFGYEIPYVTSMSPQISSSATVNSVVSRAVLGFLYLSYHKLEPQFQRSSRIELVKHWNNLES